MQPVKPKLTAYEKKLNIFIGDVFFMFLNSTISRSRYKDNIANAPFPLQRRPTGKNCR